MAVGVFTLRAELGHAAVDLVACFVTRLLTHVFSTALLQLVLQVAFRALELALHLLGSKATGISRPGPCLFNIAADGDRTLDVKQ